MTTVFHASKDKVTAICVAETKVQYITREIILSATKGRIQITNLGIKGKKETINDQYSAIGRNTT
jgi:hypothetical protein